MKVIVLIVVGTFALITLKLLIDDSTKNALTLLPEFSGIVHYYSGDINTVFCQTGDILIRRDENGFNREYWMKGRVQMLRLTSDEVYAIEKLYKVKLVY